MRQKVVVIGHGYTSRLGVIRALGREGYEVIVVVMTAYKRDGETLDTTKQIDCFSKYVDVVYYCPSDETKLIQLLLEKCVDNNQKVIIIPDSDFSAAVVDKNSERLSNSFIFPHINHKQGAIVSWMDKQKQKNLALSIGLNVANGWIIRIEDKRYSIPIDLEYPCFPKPLLTLLGGKSGLKKCDNEVDLRTVLATLADKFTSVEVLVERFMTIEQEYALLGYSDGSQIVIPGIIKTESLARGGHFGVAKQGIIVPVTGYEPLVQKFKQLVSKIGFVGIFDIDFYRSNGIYYFCEMNFRYGGSGYAYTALGVNLPVMLVKSFCGESIDNMQKDIETEAVFVNERMCRDDWANNYISTKEFLEMLQSADISFINDDDDRVPQKKFYKDVFNPIRRIKRIVKRLLFQNERD